MILLRSVLKLETQIPFQCMKKHQYILHNFSFYDLKKLIILNIIRVKGIYLYLFFFGGGDLSL